MKPKTRTSDSPERVQRAGDESMVERLSPASDGKHVGGAVQQDRDSFESLVRRHLTALRRAAYCLTHDRTAAEDLVQDTLERAYRAFDRYHPEGKARSWLGCIMRNLWITECRRHRSALRTIPLDGLEGTVLDRTRVVSLSPVDPEATILGELGVASILSAIDDLPPHLKQVVAPAVVWDAPYGAIAKALEIPVGTVASRLSRGRRRLQGALRYPDPDLVGQTYDVQLGEGCPPYERHPHDFGRQSGAADAERQGGPEPLSRNAGGAAPKVMQAPDPIVGEAQPAEQDGLVLAGRGGRVA